MGPDADPLPRRSTTTPGWRRSPRAACSRPRGSGAAVACWVASDHFEELGRPPRLVHGGFGLLSVGNLAKPRFWALRALELLGDEEVGVRLDGDGAESLVQAWASVDCRPGAGGGRRLERHPAAARLGATPATTCGAPCALELHGLPAGRYAVRHRQVGPDHSHLARNAAELGVTDWPDDDQWRALRERDVLEDLPADPVDVGADGTATVHLDLPTSTLALVELVPASS